ncbi:hypothetical protein ACHAQF_008673 [Verticillium nonalfalfae]
MSDVEPRHHDSASPLETGHLVYPVPSMTQSRWTTTPYTGAQRPATSHSAHSILPAASLRSKPTSAERADEDGYDLSLLAAAAPLGHTDDDNDSTPQYEPTEEAYDLTSMIGPFSSQGDAFLRNLQRQEANGQLTRGLGAGFKPSTTLTGDELMSPVATSPRGLLRSFSRRQPQLDRATSIKVLGQNEANRRGEVIEVIMEENPASEVDISGLTGPNALTDRVDAMRQTTFPAKRGEAQVFYPQPNWKPFSMRWPYLVALIVLSIGLAVMEELLYRQSHRNPLLSFVSPSDLPAGQYFAFKFAPTLLSVLYGVLWQFVGIEVKRLEAFYQLSKEGGALAAESINVDYITSLNWWRPFQAIKLRHWAVAVSSVATSLAVSLVPTFGAASIILSPGRTERMAHPEEEKEILVDGLWSRLLVSTLCVCAFCGCVLLYILHTRRSGLLADVQGIAGLASMAVVSHILVDFADLDVVSHDDIHAKLKHRRYVLRNASLAPDDETPVTSRDRTRYQDAHLSKNPHPGMLRPSGFGSFALAVLLVLGFIPIFLFTPASAITDKAPWLVTALAVCIKLAWGTLDTDVRMMEPYYILSRRHAPPSVLTLDYTSVPFGLLPVRAALNGHWLVFFVGFGSIMAEILTVLVTSLATVQGSDFIRLVIPGKTNDDSKHIQAGQETKLSFWVSFGLATFILVYMLVVSAFVFVRRRHPFLPRQPNTLASVLAFIHQSKMIWGFVGTAKLDHKGMVRHLAAREQQTYGLGRFVGRDGQTHCGVDEEELLGGYKHGSAFQGPNQPWDRQWDAYE